HFQRGGVVGGGEHAQQVVGGVQGQRLHHVAGTVRDRHRLTVGADRCRVDDNLGGTAVRDRGGPPVCSGVPVAGGTRGPREGCHLKSSLRGRRGQFVQQAAEFRCASAAADPGNRRRRSSLLSKCRSLPLTQPLV